MAGDKLKGVKLQGGTYYVRIVIPADVRSAFGGKGELWETLGTGNPHDAAKMAPPIREKFKRMIAEARSSGPVQGPLRNKEPGKGHMPFRLAMMDWQGEYIKAPFEDIGPLNTPWSITMEVDRYKRAAATGDFTELPNFDELFVEMMRIGKCEVPVTPEFIAKYRRDAAYGHGSGIQMREKRRLKAAHEAQLAAISTMNFREVGVQSTAQVAALPTPSITLRQLFDRWMTTKSVDDKEVGRLEHQIRRLIEFVGNKPANHLTKDEVREFMDFVSRFPGRKRSAELNALPMRELVERFEANNAAIIARNSALKPGERPEEVPGTLKAATVDEWFAAYRQMYDYAVAMLDLQVNPFTAVRKFVVKGAPSTKKREFGPEEIAKIFSAPMFTGFAGDGERGYRNKAGSNIVRDAKYWLPILALFHGGRLTEFAAMPIADLKQSDTGHWYFDLTERQVKNETSQRVIPVHPQVIKLGFLDYAEKVRKGNSPWLFPDLDHETKHGPGHAFSKWWGNWMTATGLTDPTITLHSFRHTWKRAARQSDVKEEMHDVISGHKGPAVSRSYGQGADVEPLARDMAKILFPTFPAIPVAA